MAYDLRCHECQKPFTSRRSNTKYCGVCNGSYRNPVVYMAVLENTDIVKIGFTGCLRIRIPQLSRENGVRAIVIAHHKGTRDMEQRIHEALRSSPDNRGRETYRLSAHVVLTFLYLR
jgi:hypothetical protein